MRIEADEVKQNYLLKAGKEVPGGKNENRSRRGETKLPPKINKRSCKRY